MQCSFAHFASLLKISLLSMLLAPVTAFPHGGVVLEEDICLIKVGFYQAHFTVFQPGSRQHEQFCEDLPDIGESIFVLEYLHDGLESLEVDFRIIENTTGNGSFANKEDVDRLDDIEAVTVFYQPPLKNITFVVATRPGCRVPSRRGCSGRRHLPNQSRVLSSSLHRIPTREPTARTIL